MLAMEELAAPKIDRGPLGDLPPSLEWVGSADGVLRLIDQTLLPDRLETRDCRTIEDAWEAIRTLRVRGAPAIGVAAAYGLCLGLRSARAGNRASFEQKLREASEYLFTCRPTAVNLAWAVKRVAAVGAAHVTTGPEVAWAAMLSESHRMFAEDAETCKRIGEVGAHLIPDGGTVLTHCNAGSLATVAYGTALALCYIARSQGRRFRVFADETRPLLQGARLTAFELQRVGIDVTVICDSAAASLMARRMIDVVVVGADRIAANGDTANKIGTYGLAVNARHHRVPFYVAAPGSTFDHALRSGAAIPIEQRPADELADGFVRRVIPVDVACCNPAFDVTPAELISGLVTEKGLLEPVTEGGIAEIFG